MFVWVLLLSCTVVHCCASSQMCINNKKSFACNVSFPGEFSTHYFVIGAAPLFLLWLLIRFGFDLEGAIAVGACPSSEKLFTDTGDSSFSPQASRMESWHS